ncbi:MAG: MBL fold metallo-hydrolase [Rikenellaceae bacterium]|nr:MBL fold metallo-hydrolase [Rikenellaceae bacterium]
MGLLSIFGCGKKPVYPTDTITTREGSELTFHFYAHASLAIEWNEKMIYIDPVMDHADYSNLKKADIVLVTHHHSDHFDRQAVDEVTTRSSEVVCDRTSAEAFDMNCHTMRPGSIATPVEGVKIEAVAAYNTSEGHLQFHPKDREDCGYIVTIEGTRIYIAGDTEPTKEMKALKNIDVAFLPVNQPYTMTVEQAAEAVKAIKPTIFYPYHYGQVEQKTDLEALQAALEGVTDVRIFPME